MGRRLFQTLWIFLIVWLVLNFLPVIPVEYGPGATLDQSKMCSLNYLSCGIMTLNNNYPQILQSTWWMWMISFILPVLATWTIFSLVRKITKK